MKYTEDRPGRLRMPRSRGSVIGLLLVILGAWGALIPFVGPNFDFAYTPGHAWTTGRGWLEVLPGVATAVGGLLLIVSGNRASAMLGGWLAALGGAWFVVGGTLAPLLRIGSAGDPVAATDRKRAALELAYFSGLGVLIAFLSGAVLARLAVRLARDVRPVEPVDARAVHQPAPQPYVDAPQHEPAAGVSSEALTAPRAEQQYAPAAPEPRHRGFSWRHRANV